MTNCDCITKIEEAMEKQVPGLGVHTAFEINGPMAWVERVKIGTYWKENPRSRKKSPDVTPSYCPFCGRKYEPLEETKDGI